MRFDLGNYRLGVQHVRCRLIVTLFAHLVMSAVASAQTPAGHYAALPRDERNIIQLMLIFTGDYAGMIDGDIGPASLAGIRAFQIRNGLSPSAVLDDRGLELLANAGLAEAERLDFAVVRDPWTGVNIGIPRAIMEHRENTSEGSFYGTSDGRGVLAIFSERELELGFLYEALLTDGELTIEYDAFQYPWFVVSGHSDDGINFYVRFHTSGQEVRGFWLSYERSLAPEMARVAVLMSNLFDPFPSGPPPNPPRRTTTAATPTPNTPAAAAEPRRSFGTGFVISVSGAILTNAHVVEGCSTVRVDDGEPTTTVYRDTQNDLAIVIPSAGVPARRPIAIAPSSSRLGDDVLAFGYPLVGMLADSLNVTEGIISAMSGPSNDSRYLQITAAVQPGNSGGPLLNSSGQLVGVVSATLNPLAVMERTGTLPDGIAFAIRREVVVGFLAAQGIDPVAGASGKELGAADIADRVADSIVQISCFVTG